MPKITWGRKETIIWPHHVPIYTYGAVFIAIVLTFVAVCIRIHLATPLQRYYLPVYERTSAIGSFLPTHRSTYQMLFVSCRGAAPRPAMNGDVTFGKTVDTDGKPIPLAPALDARQHGSLLFFRGQQRSYVDARLRDYLKGVVYNGASLSAFFRPQLIGGVVAFLIALPFVVRLDIQRQKQLRYGRRLKARRCSRPESSTERSRVTASASRPMA